MNDDEKSIRLRLKNDFVHYAKKCLKIRTKQGTIEPLILNTAQKHIHSRLEEQKAKTGKVRAIILKGRQQGCCFAEHMRVFTSDYRWIAIKDIKVGTELIACDEDTFGLTKGGKKHSRKFRTAIVEHKESFYKDVLEVALDNGAILELTSDHRMLCKKRGGDDAQWRQAQNFIIGDKVRIVTRPPHYDCNTYEDGWFAGIIDGEGSARLKGTKRISVHQVEGDVLSRMRAYFHDIDMPYKTVIDKRTKCGQNNKLGDKPVFRLDIHRMPYLMELFARCRPTRFTHDKWYEGHELPGKAATDGIKSWSKIVSIKPIGKKTVIDIQTSTKTFICEGLVSHNSTYVGGRFYHQVTHRFGAQAFILTHALDATQNLYKMAQRFYENTPQLVKPEVTTSNAKELIFGLLDSGYKLGTAENKSVGRSSTIQLLHGSEVAFWNNAEEHAKGILQAVPNTEGTEIILESTANGVGNYYHQVWQKAEANQSEYIAIFVPWYWQDEYRKPIDGEFNITSEEAILASQYLLTNEQLNWRRFKIAELSVNGTNGEKSFMQEYPCNATEAFQMTGEDTYIQPEIVMACRKATAEKYGKLVIGVDPARFGDDRSCIIRRKGRVAYGKESYIKKDTMEITGIVHTLIINEQPFRVFVDVGGLGAGIVDRLKELGHGDIVIPVNSGSKPLNGRAYYNKRAELWGEMRKWLLDSPCQIPDDDSLHADLCGIRYTIDSNSRLVMEKKADMKKRGVRSPDEADALALTFALTDTAMNNVSIKNDIAAKIMRKQKAYADARSNLYKG
jgi:hypothetical protein